MKTSIVILTYNKLDYTKQCIESIRSYTRQGTYELIIVDNHSTDGTVDWLKNQPDMKTIVNDVNVGFPKGCNQGMEIATGDQILLLNNDVIVTENWLDNLVSALYSDPAIGAVGPVTNSAAYYTAISASYQSLSEMHQFARNFNVSNPKKWDERLKLIGFCMLIKRQAVKKIGMLDEQFTPGNYEDDDYSVRLRKAGYKLLLCRDTFIHHYGSVSWKDNVDGYSTLLTENEKKFMKKWGTNSQSYLIHFDLIDQLDIQPNQKARILHIGCHSGGTLVELKNRYQQAELFGLESNPSEGEEAQSFAKVMVGDIEKGLEQCRDQFFDFILVSNWGEIKDPQNFIQTINRKLMNNGKLLTNMLNLSNYQIVYSILNGHNPIQGKFFSLKEITELFSKKGFQYEIKGITNHQGNQPFIQQLCQLTSSDRRSEFETVKYRIKATKLNHGLLQAIENLKKQQNIEESIKEIDEYSPETVIAYIKNYDENPIESLQSIAIYHYHMDLQESIFPYLQAAYEIDPENKDTIYNLAFMLNAYGQNDLAKSYLVPHIQKDQELFELYKKVENDLMKSRRELTFLLRRLENSIHADVTKEILVAQLKSNQIDETHILNVIDKDLIDKVEMLNQIAILCFENQLMDHVLPLLNRAYDLDKNNDDTLFNLGYILMAIGEKQLALDYFQKISHKDQDVVEMINGIMGAITNE